MNEEKVFCRYCKNILKGVEAKDPRQTHASCQHIMDTYLTLVSSYHDIPMDRMDASFLTELETLIHRAIPLVKDSVSTPTWFRLNEHRKIHELHIAKLPVTDLSPRLGLLTELKFLMIEQNYSLKYLPENINTLCRLQRLYLNQNGLITFPHGIGDLVNLEFLSAKQNRLEYLPQEMSKLSRLYILDLSYNRLFCNPYTLEYLGDLSNLRELNLESNGLYTIPPNITTLPKLEALFLENNRFKEFPTEFLKISQLKILHLQSNLLHSLPNSIGDLINLKELYLGYNYLSEIPESIGNLKNLESLGFNNNFLLKNLPVNIGNLTHLKRLYLGALPHLGSLPTSFRYLYNLEYLQIPTHIYQHIMGTMKTEKNSEKQLQLVQNSPSDCVILTDGVLQEFLSIL